MKASKQLLIVGAGGAGHEALMVARRSQSETWEVVGFADDAFKSGGQVIEGIAVLGGVAEVLAQFRGRSLSFHCAIGNNAVRQKLAEAAETAGLVPATLIDPTAVVADSARIGPGTYVAPQAFVGPQSSIGRHALINTLTSIGHHAVVGDYAQVCPGGKISGYCRLGTGAFVGSNGVLAPKVNVGDWARIGAASLAARDVPAGTTLVGVPGKIIAVPASGT